MIRTLVVVPVKNPRNAKERLSKVLTPSQRKEFAISLFQGVLDSLKQVKSEHEVLVVTDSDEVTIVARANGAIILREKRGRGETEAVELATAWAIARNFTRQVVIPGDMAHLDSREVDKILAIKSKTPYVVLAPATDDDGTNAILTSPPNALAFRFGKSSFPEYVRRALEEQVRCKVLRLKSLVLDVDTPEDLEEFMKIMPKSPARTLLVKWGIGWKTRGRV